LNHLTSMVNDLLKNQDHHQPDLPMDTLQRITALEEGALALDKKVGGDSTYVFEEYVFGSDLDVLTLLGSSLDEVDVGLFLDLVGATSRLEDSFSSGKEYTDKERSASHVGISALAADQMATLDFTTVLFFFEKSPGKKLPVEEDDGWGHKMESFARYTGAKGRAVRGEISTKVKNLTTKIKGSVVGSGVAQRLSRWLTAEVIRQVSELLNFLTDYQGELVNECNYPDKTAWRYLGICARGILSYLIVPRMEVAGVNDIGARPTKARIIWAVMQVHIRMNSLISCGFKPHSVLTTTMTTFVMKNRIDASQLESVTIKCDSVVKSNAGLDKRVGYLEVLSKTLSTDVKTLKAKK
jgi:hypothetical protein